MQHLFTPLTAHRSLRTAPSRLTVAALYAGVCAGLLALGGCSPKEEAAAVTPARTAAASLDSYDQIAQQTRGFTAGALMSANAVYVLFDPQCPHCGHLWETSQPLLKKVKFVWVPVSIINAKSLPQGAAILSAANPVEAMTTHEASILAGTGGTAAPSSIAPELEAALKQNTQVFNALRAESVPMIVAKNARTGAVVTQMGALETPALAEFLGVSLP